jgi:hypothetical protein
MSPLFGSATQAHRARRSERASAALLNWYHEHDPVPESLRNRRRTERMPRATRWRRKPTSTSLVLDREIVDRPDLKSERPSDAIKKLQRREEPLCSDTTSANAIVICIAEEAMKLGLHVRRVIRRVYPKKPRVLGERGDACLAISPVEGVDR